MRTLIVERDDQAFMSAPWTKLIPELVNIVVGGIEKRGKELDWEQLTRPVWLVRSIRTDVT
jgi:hypothetical protein